MGRVARGDLAAFRVLMERWEGAAKRYAYRVFGDYQVAEDVAQETFIRLFRAAARYQPTARFSTFFYTVLGNLCRDRLRSAKRRAAHGTVLADPPPLELLAEAPDDTRPEYAAELHERQAMVRRAVSELPTNLMEALALREFEGLSYQEIADVMRANLGEVKTWIHRGRKKLATILRAVVEEEEST